MFLVYGQLFAGRISIFHIMLLLEVHYPSWMSLLLINFIIAANMAFIVQKGKPINLLLRSRNVSSLWTIVRGKNQYIPYNALVRGSLSALDVSAINKLYNCCK